MLLILHKIHLAICLQMFSLRVQLCLECVQSVLEGNLVLLI